jgi:endonuclease G
MDMNANSRRESHYVTNMLPQVGTFNKGIWAQTEQITTCVREQRSITVYGGVIFNDPSNDIFLKSHGVKTPDLWWKVLETTDTKGNSKVISWLFPNSEDLGPLDQYLVSVKDIESQLNDGLGLIPVSEKLKSFKASVSWGTRQGCGFL